MKPVRLTLATAVALLALLASGLAAGCRRGAHQAPPVPRQRSYPRPTLYDYSYRMEPMPFGPDSIAVNSGATFTRTTPEWFDITYPAYGITLNCTLTPATAATVQSVIANRLERMARNLGDHRADVARWPGRTLVVARAALKTPVQFLATDSATYVLSGVAVTDAPGSDADSIGPVIDAIARDITHMLESL